jgi:hypothetical protein
MQFVISLELSKVVGVGTFLTCIWEVLDLNIGQNTTIMIEVSQDFPH